MDGLDDILPPPSENHSARVVQAANEKGCGQLRNVHEAEKSGPAGVFDKSLVPESSFMNNSSEDSAPSTPSPSVGRGGLIHANVPRASNFVHPVTYTATKHT